MVSHEKEIVSNTDEIDLVVFFANFRAFLRLTIGPMIIFGLLGLAAGLLLVRKDVPTHSYKLIIQVGLLSREETQAVIETWNNLLTPDKKEQLAKILQCDQQILQKVTELKASVIAPSGPTGTAGKSGIAVTAVVTDTTIVPALQKALVSGFEHNPFLAQQVDQQQAQLNMLIDRIDAEIRELDSLKKTGGANTHLSANSKNLYPGTVTTINRDLVELTEKKNKYEDSRRNNVAVRILQGFVENPLSKQNNYKKGLILSLSAGILIGFLIGIFRFARFRYPILFSSQKPRSQNRIN